MSIVFPNRVGETGVYQSEDGGYVQFTDEGGQNNALDGLRTFLAAATAGDIPAMGTLGVVVQKVSDKEVWQVWEAYYEAGNNTINAVTVEDVAGTLTAEDAVAVRACITAKTLNDAFANRLAVSALSTISDVDSVAFINSGDTYPAVGPNTVVVSVETATVLEYLDATDPSYWDTTGYDQAWNAGEQVWDLAVPGSFLWTVTGAWATGLSPKYVAVDVFVPTGASIEYAKIEVTNTDSGTYSGPLYGGSGNAVVTENAWNTFVMDCRYMGGDVDEVRVIDGSSAEDLKVKNIRLHSELLPTATLMTDGSHWYGDGTWDAGGSYFAFSSGAARTLTVDGSWANLYYPDTVTMEIFIPSGAPSETANLRIGIRNGGGSGWVYSNTIGAGFSTNAWVPVTITLTPLYTNPQSSVYLLVFDPTTSVLPSGHTFRIRNIEFAD